jgi:hypothetical protein
MDGRTDGRRTNGIRKAVLMSLRDTLKPMKMGLWIPVW